MTKVKTPKKLIEVALPLDDINAASGKEKSIRHGHPSTMHLWWARRPLAAARAVIFSQMVNDPGFERNLGRGVNKERANIERQRLFDIIKKLVQWENTNSAEVLNEARAEILKSWHETCELNRSHPQANELFNPDKLPAFHDPFAGGGALPIEAQRLGIESFASDLNPVAVLINKAMIEIPPRFTGSHPVGPSLLACPQERIDLDWEGSKGLAEDVRRYSALIRAEAELRIGYLYPKIRIPKNEGGEATAIAWLWARTVKSPSPAFGHCDVPLVSTFILSNKSGSEAYVQPVVEGGTYKFEVKQGMPPAEAKNGTKAGGRATFTCILSGATITSAYIKKEGQAGGIGTKLMAVVIEKQKGRGYVSPTDEIEAVARLAKPDWQPDVEFAKNSRHMTPWTYGLTSFGDFFTPRQLVALNTFTSLIEEFKQAIIEDAIKAGFKDNKVRLEDGGKGATAYADAIATYLALGVSKISDSSNSLVSWKPSMDQAIHVFTRQAIPMVWDFAEPNIFGGGMGDYAVTIKNMMRILDVHSASAPGFVVQADAQNQSISFMKVVSSDPPYYDNVPYADLSDFFYVWLRRSLKTTYPKLFLTISVPKSEELVADSYRHKSKDEAESFFLKGMTEAMHRISDQAHPAFPTTIYYAFKQAETNDVGTGNTGWETFLEAVIHAGFSITGTWPMRTELANRMRGVDSNALASSIVLVCRKRDSDAANLSRRDFVRELKEELAGAVEAMIGGTDGISPVAPVDLAQAVIGPGMGIFSKYSAVLEADGSPMTVHTALTLINRMLTDGADDFDADTQFCLGWFDDRGWSAGEFGQAEVLAKAKGTSVEAVKKAGVVEAASGKVRLIKPTEYPVGWSPEEDNRTPVWEALHQMIRALNTQGESASGALLAGMPQRAVPIRNLAYRLYTLCERKGWAEDARAYNDLIITWVSIEAASHEKGHYGSQMSIEE